MTNSQKELIDSINIKTSNYSSSYSSTSIFVWEDEWNLSILEGADSFSVFRNDGFEKYFFFPQGDESEKKAFIYQKISLEENLIFKYLSKNDVEFLDQNFSDVFEIQRDLDSDEYLYSISEHLALTGKKFSNCRNKLKNFSKEHRLVIKQMDNENIKDIISILRDWSSTHDGIHLKSYKKLIENAAQIGALVFIIYMDGKPFSVQGGYDLGNGIFDLCIAQENQNIPGGGYAAKHLLMETIKEKFDFVNMEEDLGLSGLRIAKSQMSPFCKNEKWLAMKK